MSVEQRAWQPLPVLAPPYVGRTDLADAAAEDGGTKTTSNVWHGERGQGGNGDEMTYLNWGPCRKANDSNMILP